MDTKRLTVRSLRSILDTQGIFYSEEDKMFVPIEFDTNKTLDVIHNSYSKVLQEGEEIAHLVSLYGRGNINIKEKNILVALVIDIFNPFYIFQIFSFIIWFLTEYEIYSYCIIFLSFVSIVMELVFLKISHYRLKKLSKYECYLKVIRRNEDEIEETKEINSDWLVPGDIILVPEGIKMPCDAILIKGSSIVNEAMLTGESIPVIKTPLPFNDGEKYNNDTCKMHTLYNGTLIVLNKKVAGEEATAIVIRTNFDTFKGSMVKSIMYPRPTRYHFFRDALIFISMFGVFAIIGFLITLQFFIGVLTTKQMILKLGNIITIAVPPALPAAMSAGVVYSLFRLNRGSIYSISPETINTAGRVKTMVFDKTGTLTEDTLNFSKLTVAAENKFLEEIDTIPNKLAYDNANNESKSKESQFAMLKWIECMASCHSIAKVGEHFIGDPLDVEMFKSTKWVLNEQEEQEQSQFAELASFSPPGTITLM